VGWMASPSFFGPIDTEVAATVAAAAEALRSTGADVEGVDLPFLREIDTVSVLWSLQQMESRPEFERVVRGHEDQIFRHARLVLETADTPIRDFIAADQTVQTLRDAFAAYFQRYDVLLCPATPFPATRHGLDDVVVDGRAWSAFQVMNATSPFSLTGMPAMTLRFGTSKDGLPIGVQVAAAWYAESTMFDAATHLENASPVRDLHPVL
jgi:aspartyl-tRNA(Asn)/glutamyl-tRNA(Gln) amidotransferase subunit A